MIRAKHLLIGLVLVACKPTEETARTAEPPGEATDPPRAGPIETPSHLLLPWGTVLFTAASTDSAVLHLGVAEDPDASPGRAVAVVGRSGDFWEVETVDDAALAELGAKAIEGLDFYAMRLFVPIDVGTPLRALPPGPEAEPEASPEARAREQALRDAAEFGMIGLLASGSNPPLQDGGSRPSDRTTDFRVAVGVKARWPDGREAGSIRREHAFALPGEPTASDVGELRCFTVRVGPELDGDSRVCFAVADVREVEFVPEPTSASLWGDADIEGGLLGDELGTDWASEGMGLTGSGMQNGAPDYGTGVGNVDIGNIGTFGTGGGGGTGGYGIEHDESMTIVKQAKPEVTGKMNRDIAHRIARAHLPEIRRCVDQAQPIPDTELELVFEVDGKGEVSPTTVTIGSQTVSKCVKKAVDAWQFPVDIPGSVTIAYTISPPQ